MGFSRLKCDDDLLTSEQSLLFMYFSFAFCLISALVLDARLLHFYARSCCTWSHRLQCSPQTNPGTQVEAATLWWHFTCIPSQQTFGKCKGFHFFISFVQLSPRTFCYTVKCHLNKLDIYRAARFFSTRFFYKHTSFLLKSTINELACLVLPFSAAPTVNFDFTSHCRAPFLTGLVNPP